MVGHRGIVRLPEHFLAAVDVVIADKSSKDLVRRGQTLSRHLRSQKPPLDDHDRQNVEAAVRRRLGVELTEESQQRSIAPVNTRSHLETKETNAL